ncbi:Rad52/Rad22 family DNA repair protein, partial [Rubrivirga sp.]|uniref:Rad52/Rad22 family DNA repair protein n=1 Tax=Rubrivirga sp. TaxID=1885344 RepID=UPI003C782561
MTASDLTRLADPFPASDIEWKPGATTRDKKKGLAMAYLTSRAVQQRFDDVCGPGDWRNEFREGPSGGVLCGISVRVERPDGTSEWVTKWDGADNSQVEAIKGGLSGATKRAAVQWGVGRYLYDLPATWVRLDDRGRFAETPRIPSEHLPQRQASAPRSERPA